MSPGLVSIVGAGPGDPGLLTLKAADRLRRADVVFYDALVPQAIVRIAARARRVFVGKRAGRPSLDQAAIHRLMIRAARAGRRVVRLKGGDPFVLGRGGEEALALRAAGVPFEIVPGVSAATAAPALAGIPVTHRSVASGFLVVSGHDERAYRPLLEALPPGGATVVVLMGLANRPAIATCLLERGWPPGTPAAVLFSAATASADTWVGTLGELARPEALAPVPGAPATICIGEVVALAALIATGRTAARDADVPASISDRAEVYGGRRA
ncbi:MAG TPA: uroporphyrinogen-III C-methyltransferase [Vicinamibacterales bacterium]|nr:uroporphyrinogen-III C-methyltransferase [Vicinamibacterales bacterium]